MAQVTDAFHMVYTPFHGTGYQQIPYVLEQLASGTCTVPEQMVIDGNPHRENPPTRDPELCPGPEAGQEVDAQLILGRPRRDRVAIQVKDRKGDYVQISGNQTGVLPAGTTSSAPSAGRGPCRRTRWPSSLW